MVTGTKVIGYVVEGETDIVITDVQLEANTVLTVQTELPVTVPSSGTVGISFGFNEEGKKGDFSEVVTFITEGNKANLTSTINVIDGYEEIVTVIVSLNGDLTTVDGTRYLVNSKGDNVTSTTGQGITINSTYTVPTSIELVDGNYIYYVYNGVLAEKAITTTITDFELNSTNLSGDGIYQNFIFNGVAFTTEQKEALEDNPETFLYRVETTNTSDVLNQSEIDGLIEWMPLLESSTSIYGMMGDAGGEINIVDSINDSVIEGDGSVTSYTKIDDTSFNIAVTTTTGGNTYAPTLKFYTTATDINNIQTLSFNAVVNSGTPIIKNIFNGTDNGVNHTVTNGLNTIDLIERDDKTSMEINWNGSNLFDIEVTDFQYLESVEATNVHTIDIDSRVKGLDTSIQAIAWSIDAEGIPIGINRLNNGTVIINKRTIGARPTAHTDVLLATKYASPTGTGDGTYSNPYGLQDAMNSLVAGDVLFLRGGTYNIPLTGMITYQAIGTLENPIIVESYPNETAILSNGMTSTQEVIDNTPGTPTDYNYGFVLKQCEYLNFRKIEVTGMWAKGLYLWGSKYCKVQGCEVHHNFTLGIHLLDRRVYDASGGGYVDGWNEVTDCKVHNNSDADIPNDGVHNEGNNADGVSVSSGESNIVTYNTVYANADDGIDAWRSNNTIFRYNLVYDQGRGTGGNGNGIKMGGIDDGGVTGINCIAEYNIVHSNKANGINENAGDNISVNYNTTWNNGNKAYAIGDIPKEVYNNISQDDYLIGNYSTYATRVNNSWQLTDTDVTFYSTDPDNDLFLVPNKAIHSDIGAYAGFTEEGGSAYSYSMSFNANQSSQIVTTVPTEPYSIKVTLPDDTEYVYTDDRAGARHLYIDSLEQATPDEITGNLTLDYVSQLTGGNIDERTKYEVYNVILTP